MSSRCCTVAPANDVPASSGTIVVTSAAGSRAPRPARIPATVDVTDFETDISRCGVSGRMPLKYCSVITVPPCRTRKPSVQVPSRNSATVSSRPFQENARRASWRSSLGSGRTAPVFLAIRALGISSRTCWNAHLLNGGSCQFASVTCESPGMAEPPPSRAQILARSQAGPRARRGSARAGVPRARQRRGRR